METRKRVVQDDEEDVKPPKPQVGTPQQQPRSANMTPQAKRPGIVPRPMRNYNFCETSESLLQKYANEPPSIELHIHHTHFRFGNQEGVLPKNSALIKIFMEYIQREEIPPAATEVFRDSGIKFYEGCIIVKIVDHRNTPVGDTKAENSTSNETNGDSSTEQAQAKQSPNPIVHRAILRPTPLSMWHDLLYTTDTSNSKFTDYISLNMEAEILSLTIRNLDLSLRNNPFAAAVEPPKPSPRKEAFSSKKEAYKALYTHRKSVPRKVRGLHEDVVQRGTEFEEMMLIMDDQRANQNANANSSNGGQFMRLSFVEQYRKKKERVRQQALSKAQTLQHQQQQQPQPQQAPQPPQPINANVHSAASLQQQQQLQQQALQQRLQQQQRQQAQQQQQQQQQQQARQRQQAQQAQQQANQVQQMQQLQQQRQQQQQPQPQQPMQGMQASPQLQSQMPVHMQPQMNMGMPGQYTKEQLMQFQRQQQMMDQANFAQNNQMYANNMMMNNSPRIPMNAQQAKITKGKVAGKTVPSPNMAQYMGSPMMMNQLPKK
ncbi:hypothetical protein TRVA0_016S02190 [Trichomonascus vanleenenianus]|uniref:Spt20p n=1 Tax=Trichomonascus vanleenenianus TaxID=2268995 RepID=UPI003ECB13C0